ncbi:MAG: carboxymuconolactone decarboxylase family protein, partial [Pseudonocardiaceae bacterium]
MSRIPLVADEDAGFLLRLGYTFARKRYGAVPDPIAVLAHHRTLVCAGGLHELLVEKASRELPSSVRELAVYRAAVRLGCSWCIDFGTMLQRMDGLDIDRLREIDDYRTSPRYSHAERLAIAYADAMTETPMAVTDEQVAEL